MLGNTRVVIIEIVGKKAWAEIQVALGPTHWTAIYRIAKGKVPSDVMDAALEELDNLRYRASIDANIVLIDKVEVLRPNVVN